MHESVIDLITMRFSLLFTCDANGDLVAINEPEGEKAPRLFYQRTAEGALWRFGVEVPQTTRHQLNDVLTRHSPDDSLSGSSSILHQLEAILRRDKAITGISEGPAFKLPKQRNEAFRESADIVAIDEHNLLLLPPRFSTTREYITQLQPCLVKIVAGDVATICFSSRSAPTACEAGLETFAAYRRRGYAAEVTRAWAAQVYASGRIPLYSTTWANTASQALARKLGGVFYAAELSID